VDLSWVNARLAVGAAIAATDVEALVAQGISHIVDCQAETDDTKIFIAHPAVNVLWDGVPDDGQPKPPDWFDRGIQFTLDALAKPRTKIYLHCAAGINRGPSMCAGVLMALGWASDEAASMIRAVRPQVGLAYIKDAERAVQALWL
jgi:dual specificity phosphatase 3